MLLKAEIVFFVSRAIDRHTKSLHKSCICAFVYLTAEVTKPQAPASQQQLFAGYGVSSHTSQNIALE
ncbi:hypothetical protein [Microcoleus sp. CAWBG58]|uniref:hypothetical protein n=1 Tax=Microcoleus sp. CAWBG58 TaxID=2841651 RepID=UPI0025F94145|nr:hypothetical protein [Microcoleus sp. CAWBG58]